MDYNNYLSPEKKEFKRVTVTSALPYANGPVHIGHLAGVYVPADIYVRYLRMKGLDVLFIGGSDEHGVPITIKARENKVTPQEVVDKYHGMIDDSFRKFGISFDIYSRTSLPVHHETAAEFFRVLYDKAEFIEKTTQQYYDEEAGQFLADRYIVGTCPYCSNDGAYGDQCEKCGSSLNTVDLINPRSRLSGNTPVLKDTNHWFLPLDKYEPWLRQWILVAHKDDWKTNVYGQCKSWLDQGLQPRAVTRDLDWGVKLPLENTEGKVLYVWFDAPIGYISATRHWAEQTGNDWKPWWKDQETRLIHFIGKDNIVFHCIMFPAMLKAEGSFILPDNVPAFEFMNLENDKISTSKNWAVWLHEYLEEFPGKEDVLRYVLTANAPETKDNDFTWKDFQTRNNSELLAIFGNFVNRTLVLTHKFFEGKTPACGELNENDREVLREINQFPEKIGNALEQFRFREALSEFMNLARLGNKYLTDNEPWKLFRDNPSRVQTILNISLQICANLSITGSPFLPFTAKKLSGLLNLSQLSWKDAGRTDLMVTGQQIDNPVFLFEKIEDEAILFQVEKLRKSKEAREVPAIKVVPQKEQIVYDDFGKMDIRTGTILEAEKVPNTQKLLKLKIDTGIDVRTVVSGIAEHYQPEQLIGKKACFLVNLEPRKIKGIESHGMILMAENHEGKLSLIAPTEAVNNGSTVK